MRFYIDPGTGSMLFTILVGVLGAGFYALRGLFVKLKYSIGVSQKEKQKSAGRIPFVIFSDNKRYWNVFAPICDEFERRQKNLVYMTQSPDDPALKKPYQYVKCEFIGEGNGAYAKLNFLSADILLSTTPGLDVYQWKRSRDVRCYVHILHASTDVSMYRMFGTDYYDVLLLSGEYQIRQVRALEGIRHLPEKEVRIVGLPYMDEMKKRLDASATLPGAQTRTRTVLLAPSWGKSGILSRYGSRMIDALASTGYHIIIRPHPQSFISEKEQMEKLMAQYPESEQLEWNRDNDNFEVLRKADILISDFSGVIFEFSLVFDRPVIYADTSFDDAPYDCCWLSEEPWVFRTLPKIGVQLSEEQFPQMKTVIDGCIDNPALREGRDRARAEAWVYNGEGTARTVDYLMEKSAQLTESAKHE